MSENVKQHTLTLLGGNETELRVSAAMLRDAIDALIEGSAKAARFAKEGYSVRSGPKPSWLDTVCDIQIKSLSSGSAVLQIESPIIFKSEVDFFELETGETTEDQVTAIDYFGTFMAKVAHGKTDELSYDPALIDTCLKFVKVTESDNAYSGIRLAGLSGSHKTVELAKDDVVRFEVLRDSYPQPRGIRVACTLDTISASTSKVRLSLMDATKAIGIVSQYDINELVDSFGKEVAITGLAHFRPSGKLQWIDIEQIEPRSNKDEIFEIIPQATAPLTINSDSTDLCTDGVTAFYGQWPGDESDEEWLKAISEKA